VTGKLKFGPCALCLRRRQLTFHHLIPRKLHRRNYFKKHYTREELQRGISLCRECHRGLHKLYDEMTLGKTLNTIDHLKRDAAIARHVQWVARQK
jgi:5-methylcytosine-specific restriction endonuclease McrA